MKQWRASVPACILGLAFMVLFYVSKIQTSFDPAVHIVSVRPKRPCYSRMSRRALNELGLFHNKRGLVLTPTHQDAQARRASGIGSSVFAPDHYPHSSFGSPPRGWKTAKSSKGKSICIPIRHHLDANSSHAAGPCPYHYTSCPA